jgi:GxxExxY protein
MENTPNHHDLLYRSETSSIINLALEVHKELGHGFLEIIYKDALEYEFKNAALPYEREKEYSVPYKAIILPRKFFSDFTAYDKIILEIKAQSNIGSEDLKQTINYMKSSGCKVGLILNFGREKLEIKRMVF